MQINIEQGIQQIAPAGGWVALTCSDAKDTGGIFTRYLPAVHPVVVWAMLDDGQMCGLIARPSGLTNPERFDDFLGYVESKEAAQSPQFAKATKQRRKELGLRY